MNLIKLLNFSTHAKPPHQIKFLTLSLKLFTQKISHFFNRSSKNVYFFKCFLIFGEIEFLNKPKKDLTQCSGYRPIAAPINCIGEVFGKVIKIKLLNELKSKLILNENQFGFQLIRVHLRWRLENFMIPSGTKQNSVL